MKLCKQLLFLALVLVTAACNTVPTSSSSSSGSPSSSSSGSSGSTSSSSSGSGQSSSSSQGSASSGQASSQQRGSASSQSGAQPGSGSQDGAQGAQAQQDASDGDGGMEGKSDEEILADALGEFEKGRNSGQAGEQGRGTETGPGSGQRAGSATGTASGQTAMTAEEKARILEAQLSGKFAKFDDLMLGEREKIGKSDNESGAGSSAGYGSEGDGEGYYDDPLQTAMAEQLPPSGRGFPGDKSQGVDIAPPPSDVGDGQDDDIIARQLREAAQKEKDPELRAKLWEEYRKYKKGA